MVKATQIARRMVTEWGMSKLGPITYEQNDGYVFLGRDYASNKNFSDQVAHEIDDEIRNIIEECHKKAAQILTENMEKLKAIAHYLLVVETIYQKDIEEIMETGKLKRVDDLGKSDLHDLGTVVDEAEATPEQQVKVEENKEETAESSEVPTEDNKE